MNICMIGTGYVGLVTGACFSYMGNSVTCIDIDQKKIDDLNKGIIPIFEPGLEKIITQSIKNNSLNFSSDLEDHIKKNDIIFIAVGTPMNDDGSSNLSYIYQVAEDIGNYITGHKIIITKSTIPVGTTHNVKEIIKKGIKKRNKKIDFDMCNNPEFLKQGKAVSDFMSPDRVVIGIEDEKLKPILRRLYKPFSIIHEKIIFMDIKSSELTKYAANGMLATKISFMNEMANIAEKVGADINDIRLGIGSDTRIGYSFIYPGVGYGGSCFPKDIHALINFAKKEGYTSDILKAVNKVNQDQKKYFFNKLFNRFKSKDNKLKGKKIGMWGLSFKPGTEDMRDSASIYFVENIIKLGGTVAVYDPKAMENAKENYFNGLDNIIYCIDKMDVLIDSDALILLTEWPEFRSPNFNKLKSLLKTPVLFDGRNQFNKHEMKKIGIEYHQIGVKLL